MNDHILLTTDLSDLSDRAAPYARALALAHGRPVRLLHVVDDRVRHLNPDGLTHMTAWTDSLVRERRRDLEGRAEALLAGVKVEPVVTTGRPLDVLMAQAADAWLVVMASHGYSGVRRFLLGSVAARLVQRCTRPVWVVGPDAAGPPVERALLGVDLGDATPAAVSQAIEVLGPLGPDVELFHADVVPSLLSIARSERFAGASDVRRAEAITERLHALVPPLVEAGLTVACHSEPADRAADALVSRARVTGAGLIALASHGRDPISQAWLGSVTDEVLRVSDRPVLVLKPEASPR